MKPLVIAAAAVLAGTPALPAAASTLYSNALLQPITTSPGSASFSAKAKGGDGSLSFNIDASNTLDGVNYYEDDFTLSHNGTAVLQLSYDLGGGGGNAIFTNTYGATVTRNGPHQLTVTISKFALAAGANLFDFAYDSPSGDALGGLGGHAGHQGIGDEGWGISHVTLTGAGVPEPATWALMILGFGAVGGAMRRRRSATVRFA